MSFASDAAAMLADFGVPVVYGTARSVGILDVRTSTGTDPEGFTVPIRERVLTVRQAWVATLSGFAEDAALTIDGAAYRVRAIRDTDDEVLVDVVVAKVS